MISDGVFSYTLDSFSEAVTNAQMPLKDVAVVISNVSGLQIERLLTEILDVSKCKTYMYAQTKKEQCGVTNSYNDFSRLGVDRWLAMIAGFNHEKRQPEESVCIIDCGTAVTLDVMDSRGCHLGGVIAPGFRLMQSILVREASDISGLDISVDVLSMCLAKSTDSAVHQGCAQLLVGGLERMISRYSNDQENKMRIIVTGGDGAWVGKLLAVDTLFEPLLVNDGLRQISREM